MKTKRHALWALACLSSLLSQLSAAPLGSAFTYQGILTDGGPPATGLYDFEFTLYDAATNGSHVAGPLIVSPVGVTNGLFTITLDFGVGVFTGDARWLGIAVRTNGVGGFAGDAVLVELRQGGVVGLDELVRRLQLQLGHGGEIIPRPSDRQWFLAARGEEPVEEDLRLTV
jgi:hypothetical protein